LLHLNTRCAQKYATHTRSRVATCASCARDGRCPDIFHMGGGVRVVCDEPCRVRPARHARISHHRPRSDISVWRPFFRDAGASTCMHMHAFLDRSLWGSLPSPPIPGRSPLPSSSVGPPLPGDPRRARVATSSDGGEAAGPAPKNRAAEPRARHDASAARQRSSSPCDGIG